jgi:hypothetical protein
MKVITYKEAARKHKRETAKIVNKLKRAIGDKTFLIMIPRRGKILPNDDPEKIFSCEIYWNKLPLVELNELHGMLVGHVQLANMAGEE